MSEQKIIMLRGLPASGKTTWALDYVSGYENWTRVNKDDLRQMLHGGEWSRNNEKQVIQMRNLIIRNVIAAGNSIIVDDTNLHGKHEQYLTKLADELDVNFEVRFFEIDLQDAIQRDSVRKNSVGAKVIRNMYNRYLKPIPEPIVYDPQLPFCIIVDLDGTLAIIGDRSPYDGENCGVDLPNLPVIETVNRFRQTDTVFIFSGRNGASETQTRQWLLEHNVNYDHLVMRDIGDVRKDRIVKKEFYKEWIEEKYNVRFVLDDRLQVCKLWHELGLTLFRVGDPAADF